MELVDTTYQAIAALMHRTVGLAFTPPKKALVSSRLTGRIQRLGLRGFEDYLALLHADPEGPEFQAAIDLLTTNETYFFREPEHFARLEREYANRCAAPVSAWSAAASYGDEPYSIAMVLADLHLQGRIGAGWSVLGTDISERALLGAREAIYPQERLRLVSPQRLKRYGLRGEGDCEGLSQLREELTRSVRFGRLNLCEPIDVPGPFDVIFLRNVLIYFDGPTKRQVVDQVLAHLRPGGLFFIGMAEGRVACDTPLEVLGPGAFRKGRPS